LSKGTLRSTSRIWLRIEYGAVDADAYGENQDHRQGKERSAGPRPPGIPDISQEIFPQADTTHVSTFLLKLRDASHAAKGGVAGFVRWNASRDHFVHELIEVEPKLVFEFGLHLLPPEE